MRRTDNNQAEIVYGLRHSGYSVAILSALAGIPDLLVANSTATILMEVKNPLGRGMRLTKPEQEFHAHWKGKLGIVTSLAEALALFGITA